MARSDKQIRSEMHEVFYKALVRGEYVDGTFLTPDEEDELEALTDEYQALKAASTRPGWDEYFLGIAEAISSRGDCTNRQIGALIVDERHQLIEGGYNGAPRGEPGCLSDGACPRSILRAEKPRTGDYDECISVHAEANAVVLAGRRARGGTIYVTDWPCGGCMKLIKAVGIVRIVSPTKEWSRQ